MSSKSKLRAIPGGVLAPRGFQGAAVSCGLKTTLGALDLALIVSDVPATAAGVFTTNRVTGMPVKVDKRRVARGRLQAIVINAGIANVCTGRRGLADAEAMTAETARALGLVKNDVAVCSTGLIGHYLPMAKVMPGIHAAAKKLAHGAKASAAVSQAIMTTDTKPKAAAVTVDIDGVRVRVGGTAKGAGMIAPNMATMLAFLTSDAAVEPAALRQVLRDVAGLTFNRITVEGDMSTSDSVLLLANGASGAPRLTPASPGLKAFRDAVFAVADSLAEQLVLDAEGATKFIEVTVRGAASLADAERAGRAIAESVLFKSAAFGEDPNWGRIACAAGYSGARFNERNLNIDFGGVRVVNDGAATSVPTAKLRRAATKRRLRVVVELGAGSAGAMFRTCDLSHAFIDVNALYHT